MHEKWIFKAYSMYFTTLNRNSTQNSRLGWKAEGNQSVILSKYINKWWWLITCQSHTGLTHFQHDYAVWKQLLWWHTKLCQCASAARGSLKWDGCKSMPLEGHFISGLPLRYAFLALGWSPRWTQWDLPLASPVTESLSSSPWASHGLLHKCISSFHSQISVPRFRMEIRFVPADRGAGDTRAFSPWLGRGLVPVAPWCPPPWGLTTATAKRCPDWGVPFSLLPPARMQEGGAMAAAPRTPPRSWGGPPREGLTGQSGLVAQGDSQTHCSC